MNRCGHVPVELDWQHGEFFDTSKLYLICATHGALYSPESGHCLGGRCNGKGLEPVTVIERNGKIFLTPTE
jgi:nitrite reductase/ring-hydroxylating ferredoxin subunit